MGRVLVAGAAGTLALEAASWLDVALRGRPPSDVPSRLVGKLAARTGIDAIAEQRDDERAQHRRSGASALLGYVTGIGAAAAAALLWSTRRSLPVPVVGLAAGAIAMTTSDAGATALGVTDPRSWSASGWLADALPHLAFGLTTAAVLDATAPSG